MKHLLFLSLLIPSLAFAGQPCKGTTKTGKPCKSIMVSKNGYCNSHNPQAIKCTGKNSKGQACKMTVKNAGDKCRFHKN